MISEARRRARCLLAAVPYWLGLRRCVHPGYTVEYSWRHRHPDGRGRSYDRCRQCRRVAWRSWGEWRFLDSTGESRWRMAPVRPRARQACEEGSRDQ